MLPGTYYLVRMLDGRIDTQGTVKDLRARGVLEEITHDEAVEAHREEQAVAVAEKPADEVDALENGKPADKKKPRKLIEDEKRETGSVKWNIYKTYLKASYVPCIWVPSTGCLCVKQVVLDLGDPLRPHRAESVPRRL